MRIVIRETVIMQFKYAGPQFHLCEAHIQRLHKRSQHKDQETEDKRKDKKIPCFGFTSLQSDQLFFFFFFFSISMFL